ncbi:MAG: outer membrane lipoprotein-sorting protein [Verrucomicrobiales bacterium]|nr:outer membrane lipoprotein-sorting protein [Verrucomicrobiales bacterium]
MKTCLFFLLSFSLSSSLLIADDAALLAAEKARGVLTGNTGVQWIVSVTGSKNAKFLATSQDGKVYAEVIEPADAKGRKYLAESKGNMWFWKPGLSRPVSVSKRQRLSGDAAIGDIASTSFVEGYKLVGKEDGEVAGEAASVYTLKANSLSDTYAQIKYWVTKDGNLGKKAEFYAKSGNLIRSSTMDYGNTANGKPFLSKMVIEDGGQKITLAFSDVRIGQYPDQMFTRDHLTGRRTSTLRKK